MLLPMTLFHLLDKNQNEVKHDALYMWCHWHHCWHHMVPMILKMTLFYSLDQDNWNEVHLGQVMPWHRYQSHGANGIINGNILFLMSKWLKLGAAWLFGHVLPCHWYWHMQHVMLMALSIVQLHLVGHNDWNEVQHDFSSYDMPLALMLASHNSIRIVKGTNIFVA